jgi:hypothetical protein
MNTSSVPYDVDCVNSMYLGELNHALADNAGSAILDNGITRIEFYKVLEHPERGQGVHGDGGGVFHGHIAADLVPHTLVLDDVGLPCPCRRPNSAASSLIGTPAPAATLSKRGYRKRAGTV